MSFPHTKKISLCMIKARKSILEPLIVSIRVRFKSLPELAAFMSVLGDKNTTVVALAVDSVNLGLCDFSCPLLI